MNEITNNIFNVPAKLEPVETATILGKEFVIYGTIQNPWFKAKDVAEWIEYDASNINKLISSVDEDEKGQKIVLTRGGNQELREYNYKNYSETGSKEWFVLTKEKLNEIVNKYQFVEVN